MSPLLLLLKNSLVVVSAQLTGSHLGKLLNAYARQLYGMFQISPLRI